MAAMPPAGLVLVTMISIAVVAVSVTEAKVKRSIEVPENLHLKTSNIEVVKRAVKSVQVAEPQLSRAKRFKRDLPEVELQRVKRSKREVPNEPGLERVKREKRTADEPKETLEPQQHMDEMVEAMALSRQKRYRRSVHLNKFTRDGVRANRAGHKVKKMVNEHLYNNPVVRRTKRGGLMSRAELAKHAKHAQQRDKRHQPSMLELAHHGRMDDMVVKAIEKIKRTKRHGPKHSSSSSSNSKAAKLHRAKRAGLKEERTAVLKDINRDINRLQRLRRSMVHNVIRDSKHQIRARNHKIVKRQQAMASNNNDAMRSGTKKLHKSHP